MKPPFMLKQARTITHPGRSSPLRIISESSSKARHYRLSLISGRSLYDCVAEQLLNVGVKSASMTLLGGNFSQLEYCVAPPDPDKRAVIHYTKPICAGPSMMVFGNATLSTSDKGEALVHCHAVVVRGDGEIVGGHIITEKSIVGDQGLSVLVTTLDEFDLVQSYDSETNIPVIKPVRRIDDE